MNFCYVDNEYISNRMSVRKRMIEVLSINIYRMSPAAVNLYINDGDTFFIWLTCIQTHTSYIMHDFRKDEVPRYDINNK